MRKWLYSALLANVLLCPACHVSGSSKDSPVNPSQEIAVPAPEPSLTEQNSREIPESAPQPVVKTWKTPEESGALSPMPNDCVETPSSLYQAYFRAMALRTDGAWMLYALRLAENNGDDIPRAIEIVEKLKSHDENREFSDIYSYHLGRMWDAAASHSDGREAQDAWKKSYENYKSVDAYPFSPYFHMARAESIKIAIKLNADPRAELNDFISTYPNYPGILRFRFERAKLAYEHGETAAASAELQDIAWLFPWSDAAKVAQIFMNENGIAQRTRSFDEVYARVNELRRMRFWDHAEDAAEDAIQQFPESLQLAVLHARIPYERSDHQEAARRFEKILERLGGEVKDKLRPQGVIAYLYRAYAYIGDKEKALKYHAMNAMRLSRPDRVKSTMEFALTCGALDVAWENAKIAYANATSAADLAHFGFIAYLNGEYAFARQKFAEAESGLTGVLKRRNAYFLAQATLKAAEKAAQTGGNTTAEAIPVPEPAKEVKKDKKNSKKSKKKPEKPAIVLAPPTVERAIAQFKSIIANDSGDYYAILANSRLMEIQRKNDGTPAPETPVIQKFGEIAQDPVPPRPWEVEFTYDEKAPLAQLASFVEQYGEFIPELRRVKFLHEAELFKERNALFRVLTFEIMGVSRMNKKPSALNLWTGSLSVGGHLVDNRKKKAGFWGMTPRLEYFSLPDKKDAEARQKLAARQTEIYEHGPELRSFARDMLGAFHDYYMARKYSPSLRQTCGNQANLDDCSTMYPHAYSATVIRESRKNHISPDLIWTLMNIESAFNPDSVSVAEAYGLLQIIPVTGYKLADALGRNDFGPYDLIQPEVSISMGTWYFAQVLHKFRGYATLSMAGYNGGPHQVARWLTAYGQQIEHDAFVELIPLNEARNYVKKGMARMLIFHRINQHDPNAFFEIPNTLPDGFEMMPNY